ncbi:hypothetical protein [Thermoactinomyces mirandus]|uniref:Uncharacterized protein n=1 Tax=Thermoactinomyces mirandus TaxID=2756294 RepID=A0A7W1XV10_9BACL|nr:hypothetical protein [Thermoactinomyces mirandus]MBA4603804.1 hypothetical protein [Thermoactinomyces mirandus]
MNGKRHWHLIFLVFLLAAVACSGKSGSQQFGTEKMQNMTRKLAMNSQVQRAFLKGRELTMQQDSNLRKEMLTQNLREQKGMFSDPGLFSQMADMNIHLTRKTLNTPGDMQDRLLETNLETFRKIKESPEKRNQLIRTLQQARDEAMKEKQTRSLLLKKGMDEHYLALNDPAVTSMVLDYTLDVQDRMMKSPSSKKRMLKNQLKSLKAVAGDPEMRPQLVAFMMELMKDPAMQAEMEKMMKQMMNSQIKKSAEQSTPPAKQRSSPQQGNPENKAEPLPQTNQDKSGITQEN